ncbi:hypothetical protein [Microbulbifer sp. ALW1]|uniref:hypothetical protein n=1 Tax=Microbulbifer sp. (strain ALW1) TaxID=1516059 RepID=UPI00135A6893|nr:hypothetical protein [Microbulbifer sp. ALW1]
MKTANLGKKYALKALVSAASIALGTIALGSAAQAEVFEMKKGEFSGSFITSYLTYKPGDRTITTIANGFAAGKKMGAFQSHTVADFRNESSDCTPDDGLDPMRVERFFIVVKSDVVLTFKKGQLFLKSEFPMETPVDTPIADIREYASGCAFFNLVLVEERPELADIAGGFDLKVKYRVVGGTGAFAGAKGELISTSTGTTLEFNDNGGGENWFGGASGTLEGSFCTDCTYP